MKRITILHTAAILSVLLSLVLTSTALAITISVDGIKEAAWSSTGEQTPGSQTDPDENNIDDRYDIIEVLWTNNSLGGTAPYGYMYFLIETVGNFDGNIPPSEPTVIICLDVDNNTSTGTTTTGYCNSMSGVDRRINAQPRMGTVAVYRWTSTWVLVAQPSGGMRQVAYYDSPADGIADYPYFEIGVDLQSLAITNGTQCISTMPGAIYYDNGITDPEDSTPDSGTFFLSCGSPTAITLQSAGARSAGRYVTPLLIAAAILAAAGAGGLLIVRRRKA